VAYLFASINPFPIIPKDKILQKIKNNFRQVKLVSFLKAIVTAVHRLEFINVFVLGLGLYCTDDLDEELWMLTRLL
jgi:hypothetical protein